MAFTIEKKTVPHFGIKASEMKVLDVGIVLRSDNNQNMIGHYVIMTPGGLLSLTDGGFWHDTLCDNSRNPRIEELFVDVLKGVELTLRIK